MSKKLAIKGHPTRGKEVIKLLEMMGGVNVDSYKGNFPKELKSSYCIYGNNTIQLASDEFLLKLNFRIFTIEEFLEKYPFKVGDTVFLYDNITEGCVTGMKWDEDKGTVKYCVYTSAECWCDVKELLKWNMILTNKETDEMKLSDSKCERTHEDAIFDSIIWHLRNSVNNGKQNLSAGECEDYFREVVKKNNENKMSDCKKCELVFGSVRCFDKDCPHNTPKSYAVGLKDGKVIECGVNNEIVMNENKPLFKTGDVVKLKGCPDKNLFWIVMDVIEDGYIFNDGKKYSFDEQHHYEKSNREVINTQPSKMKNVLTELLDHLKNTSKEELEKEFNELEEWSHVGPTVEEFMDFCDKVNKKPKYPTNYEECWDVLNRNLGFAPEISMVSPKEYLLSLNLIILKRCRDAYWKIAGKEMGLGKSWEPVFEESDSGYVYCIVNKCNNIGLTCEWLRENHILSFPIEEMRDAFYENFKDLIEQCKELL